MAIKKSSRISRIFRFADRRYRVAVGVLAVSLAFGTAAEPWAEKAYDYFGWSRVSIVRKVRIVCDLSTGLCDGHITLKKLRADCDTVAVSFAGFAGGKPFYGERRGKPKNIPKTPHGFITFAVPFNLAAPYFDLPIGTFDIAQGGIDYECGGRPYRVQYPRITALVDGIEYTATKVTFVRIKE
ncbi:MAG: hypothetical protein AAFO61_06190 [Pseudomonadota bacterium]